MSAQARWRRRASRLRGTAKAPLSVEFLLGVLVALRLLLEQHVVGAHAADLPRFSFHDLLLEGHAVGRKTPKPHEFGIVNSKKYKLKQHIN